MTPDYIIVGAGSAGCVLAARLSEDPRARVLLLEAGGPDRGLRFSVPAGYAASYFDPAVNWMYASEPEAQMAGRSLYCPRGKVLGGSGSINAMIWVRGQRRDFDDWRAAGNPGWGWDDVAPWFRALEDHPEGGDVRGTGGPVGITPMRGLAHPLCDSFLAAARELQLPRADGFNGAQFEGAGLYETNIARGRRQSSARTHLAAARGRPNLEVRTGAHALRVVIDAAGRAAGVEVRARGGRGAPEVIEARAEVILAAGAVGSPMLLAHSGLGNPADLGAAGIEVRRALPAVGANLQDHLCASFYFRARVRTLNNELRPWWGRMRAGLRYLVSRSGPLALSVNQAGGFFRTNPAEGAPNVQIYFNPLSYRIPADRRARPVPEPYPGFLIAFNACRPDSRGSVSLASPDPLAAPRIRFDFLASDRDRREAVEASRLIRRLVAAPSLAAITEGEVSPGPGCADDAGFLDYVRREGGSIYHLCGTCAMGPDPAHAVVDAMLRVHGVPGLRVADASVFPNITSGNINAAVMMLAERAADLIRRGP